MKCLKCKHTWKRTKWREYISFFLDVQNVKVFGYLGISNIRHINILVSYLTNPKQLLNFERYNYFSQLNII